MPILDGIVTSGFGKGAIFLSLDYYKQQIKEKMGFIPYAGTLNVKTSMSKDSALKLLSPIRIDSLNKNGKKYGGASCYPAKISDVSVAVIIPDLTTHEQGIIEIIAPINLKSQLKIKDGDKIKVELSQ